MVKSLLLNSALLEIRIPALAFNCSYASSVMNKIRNPLKVCGKSSNLRIPLTFCGNHLHLRNSKQLAIFGCCKIRKKNQWAGKYYVTVICTQNPLKFCKWNPLTFWNMFKDLSLKSRNRQTQKCAPIQCTVWHRNVQKRKLPTDKPCNSLRRTAVISLA